MARTNKQVNVKASSPGVAASIFVLYDGFDILDVSGPYAFFQDGGLNPVLAAVEKRKYKSVQGIEFQAQYSFKDKKLLELLKGDFLLFVPGGYGPDFVKQFYNGNPMLTWLSQVTPNAKMVSSVCTGALIAAAAGLLDNCEVTTHWAFTKSLELFKKSKKIRISRDFPRYVHDKKHNVVTGGGISSGLDESIYLISLLGAAKQSAADEKAMEVQLITQYAPFLQFNAGLPATAPATVLKTVREEIIDDFCRKQLDPAIKKMLK